MLSEAGPSKAKRPRNKTNYIQEDNTEVKKFLYEDFVFYNERNSSSDDGDRCQLPLLESPNHLKQIDRQTTSSSTSSWSHTGEMKNLQFTATNVFHGPHNGDPVDYFNFFFDEDFLKYICDQSNEQAVKLLVSEKTIDDTRMSRWKKLTVEELKIFLGLLFHMGTIQLNRIQDYWKTDRLFSIPIFTEQMSKKRFEIIKRCLHFTSQTSNVDPLYKIRFLINYFNKKMTDSYYPAKVLIIKQYIKKIKHHYGVKFDILTEPDGLILKFRIHAGSNDIDSPSKGHAEKIVLHLLEGFLGKGHEIYVDNYYTSVALAKTLLERNTHCTGILSSKQKTIPKEVMQKKLRRGENISRFNDGINVGKWRNNREVTYITTQYTDFITPVANKRGQVKDKPLAVARYSEFMYAPDRQDQFLSVYPCERKCSRWYLKLAIHTFELLLVNSYNMYNKYSGKPKMRLCDYRLSVIDKLLPKKNFCNLQKPLRTNLVHTLRKIPERTSEGRVKRKHCRQCYIQKKRCDTTWHCVGCIGNPGLCVECFDSFHAKL